MQAVIAEQLPFCGGLVPICAAVVAEEDGNHENHEKARKLNGLLAEVRSPPRLEA